jgi:hypothetical protein
MTGSYAYHQRRGIRPISWNDFHGICKALAAAVAPFDPEIILPVGRGGYYPGTLLAHILLVEVYPVRLSRRENDKVVHDSPRWLLRPPDLVAGKRVLIVDEISDSGETLQVVKAEVAALGAAEVRTAVLYAHARSADVPDYIGLIADELLLNPWDREIYRDGAFQMHPEYASALTQQGVTPDDSLLVAAAPFKAAKG